MAYDRGYRRERERGRGRRRELDYGWGVPIRGMYDYSPDYGGLSGPESEDSETIPPYETGRRDGVGPRPRYETHHWAAAEPAGERRYRESARGRGAYGRDLGPFRSAFEGARARAWEDYARDFRAWRAQFGDRRLGPAPDAPARGERGASLGPGRDLGGAAGRAGSYRHGYGGEYGFGGPGGPGERSDGRERGSGSASGAPAGYPGYRFRDGSGGEPRRRGVPWGSGPAPEGPFHRRRGARGRWGRYEEG